MIVEAARRPAPCHGVGRRCFRFFDTAVELRSDLPEMLSFADAMFAGFAVAPEDVATSADVACSVLRGPGEKVEIRLGERCWRAARADAVGMAYMVLFHRTLGHIRSHLLLHAGALEHPLPLEHEGPFEQRGRGVLVVGDSGAGKSSLVMELVSRGLRLLSDDVGALNLESGLLDPFPRSLGFVPEKEGGRKGRSPGLGVPEGIPESFRATMPLVGGGEKVIVRPEALGDRHRGRSCPPSLLVCLPGGGSREMAGGRLHVVLSELPEALRSRLADLPEGSEMAPVPNRLFPELRFRTDRPARLLGKIDEVCATFAVAILETSRGGTRTVHTDAEPELRPLAKGEALRLLLRQLHITRGSALVDRVAGGSGARLLLELGRLLEGTRCFTLTVGRLDRRADRICEALDELGARNSKVAGS
jgi:hypothetical protein